jgi:O-acetyl-ADP-ribose deacetylase (regulator of RNase III)
MTPASAPRVEVVTGDITRLAVDAVVNAANTAMRGGGGVDGAIHRAAGPGLLAECVERFPRGLPTGAAGWTHGHRLPARWVVHVVGPVYDGTGGNRHLLESCYREALAVADELATTHEVSGFTMAFPLVSAGIYGWPLDDAATVAAQTVRSTETKVARVQLVAFGDAAERALRRAVGTTGEASAAPRPDGPPRR